MRLFWHEKISGDSVNIAARLEALADPGGICISETTFDQIETKLSLGYEYLEEQSAKIMPISGKALLLGVTKKLKIAVICRAFLRCTIQV